MAQLDFDEIFNSYIASTQKTWDHDRSETVGASEVFGCIRRAFYLKRGKELGIERDEDYEDNWGATRRGDLIEEHHVVPAIRHWFKENAWIMGKDQVTLIHSRNSATPDGLLVKLDRDALALYGVPDIKSTRIIFEIKSIDPRVNLKEAKRIHHGQTITQMGMIRDETENDEDKPQFGVILYVNASFLDDMAPMIVEYDPEVYHAALIRAESVWKFNDPIKFAPEGRLDDSCKHCEFRGTCMGDTIASIPEDKKTPAEEAVVGAMDPLMKRYIDAKIANDEAVAAFKVIKEEVKGAVVDAGQRRIEGEDWKVSYSSVKGKETLDQKAMIDDGIDLDAYKKRGLGYDKLTVTVHKQN